MQGRIEDVREQLEAEREANRENRRLIAALTSRIPELEAPAPSEPRESDMSPGPSRTPSRTHTDTASDAQTATQRPWWRRVFEG
jgi:hypothetical protein